MLGKPPEVIKTIWSGTGEVWFTLLRSWKKDVLSMDLIYHPTTLKVLLVFWFLQTIHYYILSLLLCFPTANMASLQDLHILSPQLKYHPGKTGLITSNCSHRPCFIFFMEFTIIWNYWTIYLALSFYCLTPAPSLEHTGLSILLIVDSHFTHPTLHHT